VVRLLGRSMASTSSHTPLANSADARFSAATGWLRSLMPIATQRGDSTSTSPPSIVAGCPTRTPAPYHTGPRATAGFGWPA